MEEPSKVSYRIDWVDRETLACQVGSLTVLVWVDFEPGLLSKGRVIHQDSVRDWLDSDSQPMRPVTSAERHAIVAAVQQHYEKEGRRCTVQP